MTYAPGSCAIAGIGATEFSRKSGRSVLALAAEASAKAIADAGIERADVDGIVRCDSDVVLPNDLAQALGVRNLSYWGSTGMGGAAPCGMVAQAVAAICAGLASNVLVFRSLNGRSGERYGQAQDVDHAVGGDGSYDEYFLPYGLTTPGQMWALIYQRHEFEFGTRRDALAEIAQVCRENANQNPVAQMYSRPMTIEDYLNSPVLASPLRLFDYCLETDGACAVLVTSAERAQDGPNRAVHIRAVTQGTGPGPQGGVAYPSLMRNEITTQPSRWAAERLYRNAEVNPADIDVAQFYDCFTPTVLLQLEDYGFCAKGEGGDFALSGALRRGGDLPINTAGGNLSEGYIHGMTHIAEGVRQIRGTSTSQVPDARLCLVTSGLPVTTSALVLEGR